MKKAAIPLLEKTIVSEAVLSSLFMLDPRVQIKNPVMFSTYVGASFISLTLLLSQRDLTFYFELQIALWLWFTILFANFAEALAECRGKAHAASLRKTKTESFAKKWDGKSEVRVAAYTLSAGDIILAEAGDMILADGDVIEGVATVDESAITGESAPVIRESGGDRSAVTAGTRVLSDRILIQVTSEPGKSFLDKMIQLVEGAKRQKTPNEIALHILLSSLTILFLVATISAKLFFHFSVTHFNPSASDHLTLPILVALFVCLIPTTISALVDAIGIAGLFRLIEKNVIAKSGRSVEAAGDIDLLILDKTGTITIGNRMATSFIPVSGTSKKQFAEIALLASLSDETPEGRSIVILAKKKFELSPPAFAQNEIKTIPFSAKSRMSGIDFLDKKNQVIRSLRKGAVDAIKHMAKEIPSELEPHILVIAKNGGTPILVAENDKVVGIIELKDIVKGGIRDRFIALRKMGIRTVMVTGDNPLTAAAIAAEAGVDDYVAEATPEMKLDLIKREQAKGRLVAMTGDGTNDAPALAQADVAVAMNTGTQASREAGNMVDLDSNPTKLLDVVEIGKQLLMTRGALTTFSIANDIAKYFAILPAIFSPLYLLENERGPLSILNIMSLASPESAILSAVIFNALIILALIPLALKGVAYKPEAATQLLKKNLYLYGLGGIVTPFIGIKAIDIFLIHFGVV